jgi:hypothetical protein
MTADEAIEEARTAGSVSVWDDSIGAYSTMPAVEFIERLTMGWFKGNGDTRRVFFNRGERSTFQIVDLNT